MMVTLKILAPAKWAGKAIAVRGDRLLIGRDANCQLRSHSSQISGRHCAVLVRAGRAFLRDLDSSTGTLINGRQMRGEIELVHDDRLTIGPLTLAVGIEAAVQAAAANPCPAPRFQPRAPIDDDAVADMLLFMESTRDAPPAIEIGPDTVDTPLAATHADKPANGPNVPSRLPPVGKPGKSASSPTRDLMQKLLGKRR